MYESVREDLRATLEEIRGAGLHKPERVLGSPQSASVEVTAGGRPGEVLNFCANNYLGLADIPEVVAAAKQALDRWGYGMASVRFICGTQEVHKELEARLSRSSAPRTRSSTAPASTPTAACSRRCSTSATRSSPTRSTTPRSSTASGSARRAAALRQPRHGRARTALKEAGDARRRLIVTDGVFSMDGYIAPLDQICDLAEQATARWSWSTTRMRSASSAPAAAARTSCTG
jgi:glycine C-acetyltransferase